MFPFNQFHLNNLYLFASPPIVSFFLMFQGKDFARLFVADYSVSGRSSNSKQTQSVDDTVCV